MFLITLLSPAGFAEAAGQQPAGGDEQSHNITIATTLAGEVEDFALAGYGSATIDWGDGSEPQSVFLRKIPQIEEAMRFQKGWLVPHTYTKNGKKNIVITGNVTGLVVLMRGMATAIDVSRMPGLEFLDCYHQQLTSLDVSRNTALWQLRCGRNRLSTLDVSGLTELRYLWCTGNGLSSLNISGCRLVELFCEDNNLTSLDGSGMAVYPRSINCCDNLMEKAALIELFSALPERNGSSKIYCAGNPGYTKLTAEDKDTVWKKKGWSVLSRSQYYLPL